LKDRQAGNSLVHILNLVARAGQRERPSLSYPSLS
jgi:hypothetical protein